MGSAPKTRPTSAPVGEFLARQPEARRADCEVVSAMMQAATGEPPVMWGDAIVGFGRYLDGTGRNPFEWPVVAFSPRKQDLVLYLMPGFDGMDGLLARLGKHKTGRSCLYLKRLTDVDLEVLRALVEAAVAAMAPRRVRA